MAEAQDFQQRVARIEALTQALERTSDPAVRALVKELTQSVMELHGTALHRTLELVHDSGPQGAAIIDGLGQDPLAGSLLILHGLHPLDLESRVAQAVGRLQPLFRKQHAEVELMGVDDGVVRLGIAPPRNAAAGRALKSSLEEQFYALAPDVTRIEGLDALGAPELVGIETRAKLWEPVRPAHPRERCELCAAPMPSVHQHLLEPASRALVCTCDACAMLFSTRDGKFRRVPRRIRLIRDFHLPDQMWEDLAIPINMAYFCHDSVAGRAKASYPSPAGATESLLGLDAWRELVAANPILSSIEPDVEGLLANRLGLISGSHEAEYFLLPIDECYKLVGLIRTHWSGLSGGTEMWKELGQFLSALRERAQVVEGAVRA